MATDRLGRVPTIVLALVVPVVALATVLITLNVTSDGTSATGTTGTAGTAGTAITIKNFQFSPNPIVVPVGKAITVTNADSTVHTLTADDKRFDTGNIDGGATASITIAKPGKYSYHCDIHNYMTGTIEAR
jgi:plastocyanin